MEIKPGDTINNGQYEIIRTLEEGAYGQTYLATNKHRFGAQVVIKKLILLTDDQEVINDAKKRFEQEAKALAQMGEGSQIPEFKAHFEDKEEFFLVQEYIEGCSLRKEIDEGDYWIEDKVIKFLKEILPVLSFVHA